MKRRVDVHIERAGLKALGWLKIVRKNNDSYAEKLLGEHGDWPLHEAAELPYLRAEEDRLLYVAATRAREVLVVSRSMQKLGAPAWGVLNGFLDGAPELRVPSPLSVPLVAPLDCGHERCTQATDRQIAAHARVSQASWTVTSVTAEARHVTRMTRSVEVCADDPSKVVGTDTPAHRADAGRAWGTLIHGLLEHAMRHGDASADDLRRLGMWLTVEEPRLREVLDLAVNTVLQVSKADFWEEAKRSDHSVETPFAVGEGAGAMLTGVIDLLFGRDGSWQIIDYKTDLDLTDKMASYQQQLKMYQRALAAVGINDVATAIHPVRGLGDT